MPKSTVLVLTLVACNFKEGLITVLATAFENCPDILKVDWEMHQSLTAIGHFILTLERFCQVKDCYCKL